MWRPLLDETVENLESAFRFNVAVPFELIRLAAPHLLDRPGASVENIVSGAINLQARGHLSYDASKGALFYAARSMPASLGPRVRVNGIMRGIVESEAMRAAVVGREGMVDELIGRTRMRRLGTPLDGSRGAGLFPFAFQSHGGFIPPPRLCNPPASCGTARPFRVGSQRFDRRAPHPPELPGRIAREPVPADATPSSVKAGSRRAGKTHGYSTSKAVGRPATSIRKGALRKCRATGRNTPVPRRRPWSPKGWRLS